MARRKRSWHRVKPSVNWLLLQEVWKATKENGICVQKTPRRSCADNTRSYLARTTAQHSPAWCCAACEISSSSRRPSHRGTATAFSVVVHWAQWYWFAARRPRGYRAAALKRCCEKVLTVDDKSNAHQVASRAGHCGCHRCRCAFKLLGISGPRRFGCR